jgi:hypothetical protein
MKNLGLELRVCEMSITYEEVRFDIIMKMSLRIW